MLRSNRNQPAFTCLRSCRRFRNSESYSSAMSSAMASSMAKNSSPFKVVLGSSSPARREILADMGYGFTVMCADIDERAIRREKPEELVKALAEAKAEAIKLKLHGEDSAQERDQPTILITSDQVMVSKGMIRERPKGQEEAREFIKGISISNLCLGIVPVNLLYLAKKFWLCVSLLLVGYSGDKAFAVNYVLVTNLSNGASKGGWDIPEIYFHHIPEDFIQSVVKEGHMTCVAGGLKLTHPSVLPFIKQLIGTMDSVRGLPRELTERLIQEVLGAK
uniref:Maf-like protein n=1 Tax=Oryza glumipatula TaxID=40148 RepID=A0A0D9ZCG0_9ORYZ